MPTRIWSGSVDTDLNNPLNYGGSGPLLSTDDILFDSGSVNAIASANLDVLSLTTTSGFLGYIDYTGYEITHRNGFSIDHSGNWIQGTRLIVTNNGAVCHVGNSVGTMTRSNCNFEIAGTGVILDEDKNDNIYWKQLIFKSGCSVTFVGTEYSGGNKVIFENTASVLLLSSSLVVRMLGLGPHLVLGVGAVIAGYQQIVFYPASGGASTTIPAINTTNDIYIHVVGASNYAVYLGGAIQCGNFDIPFELENACVFDTAGYNITCNGRFRFWASSADSSFHFRSSIIHCTLFSGYPYSTPYTLGQVYMDSAQVFVAGDIFFKPLWTWDHGTSLFTVVAPGNVNSNGLHFWDLTIASPTGGVTITPPLLVDGTYKDQTQFPIDWTGLTVFINGNANFGGIRIWNGAVVVVNGVHTIFDPATELTFDANTVLILANNGAILTTNGVTMPRVVTANVSYPDPNFVDDTLPPYGAAQSLITPLYRTVPKEEVKHGVMHGPSALLEGEYMGEDVNTPPSHGDDSLLEGETCTVLGVDYAGNYRTTTVAEVKKDVHFAKNGSLVGEFVGVNGIPPANGDCDLYPGAECTINGIVYRGSSCTEKRRRMLLMFNTITVSQQAQVLGDSSLSEQGSIVCEAVDKVVISVPHGSVDLEVDLFQGNVAAIKVVSVKANVYPSGLSYKAHLNTNPSIALDSMQMFAGQGMIALMGATPDKLFFSNAHPSTDSMVTVLIGRDATP
jgi:hypothetical protein